MKVSITNKYLKPISLFVVVILVMGLLTSCRFDSNRTLIQQKELVMNMYQYFNSLNRRPLKLPMLKKFYTPNVVMISNGQFIAKGYQGFYNHFENLLKDTKHFKFVFSNDSIIAEGNKVAVEYYIKFYMRHKPNKAYHIIAIYTFQGSKISKWNEVVADETLKQMHLN